MFACEEDDLGGGPPTQTGSATDYATFPGNDFQGAAAGVIHFIGNFMSSDSDAITKPILALGCCSEFRMRCSSFS